MEPQPFARQMQKEMIEEIERNRPAYIVFVSIQFSWLAGRNRTCKFSIGSVMRVRRSSPDDGNGPITTRPSRNRLGGRSRQNAVATSQFVSILRPALPASRSTKPSLKPSEGALIAGTLHLTCRGRFDSRGRSMAHVRLNLGRLSAPELIDLATHLQSGLDGIRILPSPTRASRSFANWRQNSWNSRPPIASSGSA